MVPIQEETRKLIQEKVSLTSSRTLAISLNHPLCLQSIFLLQVASKLGTDQTIFDTAQQEVRDAFIGSIISTSDFAGRGENDEDNVQELLGQ